MVLAGMFEAKLKRRRERELAAAREEARKEGEAKANAATSAWYKRMREAEARGEPFDEPPPFESDANGNVPRS